MENFIIEVLKSQGLWAGLFALLFWWYLREVKARESVTKDWLSAIIVIQTKVDTIEAAVRAEDSQTKECASDHGNIKESLTTLTETIAELKGNEFDKRSMHEKMLSEQAVLRRDVEDVKAAVGNVAAINASIGDIKQQLTILSSSMLTTIRGVSNDRNS